VDIREEDVAFACNERADRWAFGNQVLYDLCKKHPDHERTDVVIAKVWLIGRSYAAAVERRKRSSGPLVANDPFYENYVAPTLMRSRLDEYLSRLRQGSPLKGQVVIDVLATHKHLQDVLSSITGLEKRSFVSKYLHFHLPKMFLLYDTRATQGLSKLLPRWRSREPIPKYADPT